jgi:membrane protein DedA with SNARE-associated domain
MIWAAVYLLIGILLADQGKPKGGGKSNLAAYIVVAITWPFVLLLVFIDLVDHHKRGGRNR